MTSNSFFPAHRSRRFLVSRLTWHSCRNEGGANLDSNVKMLQDSPSFSMRAGWMGFPVKFAMARTQNLCPATFDCITRTSQVPETAARDHALFEFRFRADGI